MDVGSIFLILALGLAIALFVASPFLSAQRQTAGSRLSMSEDAEHRRSALMAERDRLLTAIQELDFDHRLGKIPGEDYPASRAALMQSAALVLRRLDEYENSGGGSAEDRIERVVAERRADAKVRAADSVASSATVSPVLPDGDEIETLIAARRRERSEKSSGFCPKCGRVVVKSDQFCSRCGASL